MIAGVRACASGLALALFAAGACGDDEPNRVRPVAANPQPPAAEDAGSGDSGRGVGFIPRPGGSVGGAAPAKTPLSELDADGVAALCEELDARFAARIEAEQAARFACTLLGLSDAIEVDADGTATVEPAMCAVGLERCLSMTTGEQAALDCAALASGARSCELSIEQLQACFDAEIVRVAARIDVLSCSLTTVEELDALLVELLASGLPECQAVVNDCPDLLPGIALGSSSLSAFDGCADNCESALDGICDDGADGSTTAACVVGSDCNDCGPR
jgi:hypothetical protein